MQRRTFIQSLVGTGALSGCANSPLGKTISTLGGITLGGGGDFDANYVAKLPYASIIVSRANSQKVLLILGKAENQSLHWVSSDRSVLVTRNNRLIRTVGLEENLIDTHFINQDYSERVEGLSPKNPGAHSGKRSIDIQPGNRFGILVDSILEPSRQERITILDKAFDTTLWVEKNHAKALNWSFENRFWADTNGIVWKSQQHVAPKQPVVTMEIAKGYQATA